LQVGRLGHFGSIGRFSPYVHSSLLVPCVTFRHALAECLPKTLEAA